MQIRRLQFSDNIPDVLAGQITHELADFHVPVSCAITGGTGAYSAAGGEQVQEVLGFDMARGVSLSVRLNLE